MENVFEMDCDIETALQKELEGIASSLNILPSNPN
jgi:hypothetical protein